MVTSWSAPRVRGRPPRTGGRRRSRCGVGGGREGSATAAARDGYGSRAVPNAAGRGSPGPSGRVGTREPPGPQPPCVGTMRPPCSGSPEGPRGPQAGTPARRGHPVSGMAGWPWRLQGNGRARGAPARRSCPRGRRCPQRPEGRAASRPARVDPRVGVTGAAERPGRWGLGRTAGWSRCAAVPPAASATSPTAKPEAWASSGTRSCFARGPSGGGRWAGPAA